MMSKTQILVPVESEKFDESSCLIPVFVGDCVSIGDLDRTTRLGMVDLDFDLVSGFLILRIGSEDDELRFLLVYMTSVFVSSPPLSLSITITT